MSGLRRAALVLLLLAPIFFGAGCETLSLSPATSETRVVYPVKNAAMTVTVTRTMSFDDSSRRVYSVTVPQGVYKLEAEDADYWYFVAPSLFIRATYDGKEVVDQSMFCGGLMIGKKPGMIVPAAIYRSDGSMNLTMIWRFGGDFMKAEGKAWLRSEKR